MRKQKRKMAIITSYFEGEAYGVLGPQMAATIIEENTFYACIVIGVTAQDNKSDLKMALSDYFKGQMPVVGFSTLSGRKDLFSLAGELKEDGAITILAGPQSNVDFKGEIHWKRYPHRFEGVSKNFSFAMHGPAEQVIFFLNDLTHQAAFQNNGFVYIDEKDRFIENRKKKWEGKYLKSVHWENLYRLKGKSLIPHRITVGQVLQQIGCPHAAKQNRIIVDDPVLLGTKGKAELVVKGCSFCDVATDKGFYGALDEDIVMAQIMGLPELMDKRKIPFELINENPLPSLPKLLETVRKTTIRLSAIHLTLRADYLLKGKRYLIKALQLAQNMGIRVILASVGFESFSDKILRNLNKGITVAENLGAVNLIRRLKKDFPFRLGYLRNEGGNHGFIHPTPWDDEETQTDIDRMIHQKGLSIDILPNHSTPLIIHHASGLGDWIRAVESKEAVWFIRYGSIIGWWENQNG